MKISKRVTRSQAGCTVVTVTVEKDGLKSAYAYKTTHSGITEGSRIALKHAVTGLEALEAT